MILTFVLLNKIYGFAYFSQVKSEDLVAEAVKREKTDNDNNNIDTPTIKVKKNLTFTGII